jgi:hypothetical protein
MRLLTLAVLVPAFAFAGIEDPLPTEEFVRQLLNFIMSPKGGTLAIVAGVVQLAMVFLVTPLSSFVGRYKLTALYTLSAIATLVGTVASGMSWLEALVSSAVLAAVMNAVHQWLKPVTADK